mgnify:CR=1 FL=1
MYTDEFFKIALYMIVGMIICLSIVLPIIHRSRRSSHIPEYGELADNTLKFVNGTYSVILALNSYTNYNYITGYDCSEVYVKASKEALLKDWGIGNIEDGLTMVEELYNGLHNSMYLEEVKDRGIDLMDETEFKKYCKVYYKKSSKQKEYVHQGYRKFNEYAILGWDLGRANMLLGDFYISGYLTKNEYRTNVLRITNKIQKSFHSWEEFNLSFMCGYLYWSGDDVSQPSNWKGNFQHRLYIIKKLNKAKDSPYKLPWNTPLI